MQLNFISAPLHQVSRPVFNSGSFISRFAHHSVSLVPSSLVYRGRVDYWGFYRPQSSNHAGKRSTSTLERSGWSPIQGYQLLAELEAQCPRPAMLIVHVGTNDLGDTDFFCMRQRIALFMKECCDKYPWTKLVWSDILPRACYFGTINPSKLEMKRRAVNRWARSLSRRMGVSVLHHPQFRWSEFSLYRYDGVHLSHTGNMHFRSNLRDCIRAAFE